MAKVFGIALIALALGIAIVPHFTDCLSQGMTTTLANGTVQPMKCHWTAQAEIAIGVPLVLVGSMLAFMRSKRAIVGLSAVGVLLGAIAIAVPISLIGTCPTATHICNTVMKPALGLLGSMAIVSSLGAMILALRAKDYNETSVKPVHLESARM
jgi:hypothetical protein